MEGHLSKFLKPYEPKATEERIYKAWEESGFFNPDNLPKNLPAKQAGGKNGASGKSAASEPFTIIMPPLNANGHIHAGHALIVTLEDIMIRYKRMRGWKTLWVPGTDHAGFETQIVYEKKLEKEGRSRFKMEPRQLFDEIMAFTLENKKHIQTEVRRLGPSCDWSREKFTLDPAVVSEVHHTFKKMYDDDLIYRGNRLVNWCTKHQTSLSDVETESKELTDTLYYLKYGPLTVATVRPETIFGDVAVAVNPDDTRYRQYIGTEITAETPIGPMKLKVVADEIVDPAFGTGALKITPAHDKNDFDLAQRHNLPLVEVIDQFGKLTAKAGKYSGMKIAEARKMVAADLEVLGLIVKKEPYKHMVPVCYKCETVIEPRLIPQWFVKMQPLAAMALEAVNAGKIEFLPDNYRKIFIHWMENPIDWNISRQIVWGIPIPAKICDACGWGAPDLEDKLTLCPQCEKAGEKSGKKCVLRKDTDTFDTWFSSGQWPLLALGYPDGADFKTYYPTNVMETGADLIFKWIPRMVIFGLYLTKELSPPAKGERSLSSHVPFRTVYLNGLVNDAQGKKMSKSKGNVVNPTDLIEKFGTDALRMALIVGNTPGSDLALSENKIKGYKNFANKLWNITRFIVENAQGELSETKYFGNTKVAFTDWSEADHTLISERDAMIAEITAEMDEYKFHLVSEKLYHYVWHRFADTILEESKKIFQKDGHAAEQISRRNFLCETLRLMLTCLHPFMPFITEEIWQTISASDNAPKSTTAKNGKKDTHSLLMIESWPAVK